jgi:hypothetical protein
MSLFAQMDLEDIVWLVMVILFFIGPAVWKVIAASQQKNAPPTNRPPRMQQQAGRPAAGDVDDEISQFLRSAAERRGQPPQQQRRQQQARQQQARQQQHRPAERPLEAAVLEDEPSGRLVAEHVREHLSNKEFTQRASQLGQQVSQTDDRVEERVRGVFDHQVGSLARKQARAPAFAESEPSELPITAAAGLAAVLSNADSVRQAILINEILTRPEERWG